MGRLSNPAVTPTDLMEVSTPRFAMQGQTPSLTESEKYAKR